MNKPLPPPPYLTVGHASRILRWDWKTTRAWAEENDLIVRIGDRDFISARKIRLAFPDVYADMGLDEEG